MVGDARLEFSVLGSGSSGNSVLVRGGGTTLLVDAGLSLKETCRRLGALGVDPAGADALLVTHEHADHVAHAARLSTELDIPVLASDGTRRAAPRGLEGVTGAERVEAGRPQRVGGLEVLPVAKPHDAEEPVAFLFRRGDDVLGVFTDLGRVDGRVAAAVSECTLLVMEANHDPDLLARGSYPRHVKRRVGGGLGHISNEDSARALAGCLSPRLRVLVLSHLSRQNNRPALVRRAFVDRLGASPGYGRWISHQGRATPLFGADGCVVRRPERRAQRVSEATSS